MLVECPKCDGTGLHVTYITFMKANGERGMVERKCKSICRLCDGTGKVTWIDRILRKV